MRTRHVAPVVGLAVVCGASAALASHPQIDPATVPTGFLTAHSSINNVPAGAIATALRSGKTDVFIEHGRLDPNGSTGFQTNPGPVFVVIQRGSLAYEDAVRGRCRRKALVTNRGVVDPGRHVHQFVAGTSGADYYAVYLLPRRTGPHFAAAPAPRGCAR
jgi:hypothetical protein